MAKYRKKARILRRAGGKTKFSGCLKTVSGRAWWAAYTKEIFKVNRSFKDGAVGL